MGSENKTARPYKMVKRIRGGRPEKMGRTM